MILNERVRNFFRQTLDRLSNLFWAKPEKVRDAGAPRARQKREKPAVWDRGAFYFRETILNDLDDYFVCMRKLRKADPEAYETYSKLGVSFVAPSGVCLVEELDPRWKTDHGRIGLGGVSFTGSEAETKANIIPIKLAYFQRYARPPITVQACGGDVYGVTLFVTRNQGKPAIKFGVPLRYYVEVRANGSIRLLKELHKKYIKPNAYTAIPQRAWDFPSWVNEEGLEDKLAPMFALIVSAYEGANSDVRVRVRKAGITATFSVDMLRMPYFFADRDTGQAARKKIFHIVRTHKRVVGTRESYVKAHFRGERNFIWKGYEVNITVPGLHHRSSVEMNVAGEYIEDELDHPGTIGMGEFAKRLDAHMSV